MTEPAAPPESPRHERREFMRAFTEHAWARPGAERRYARPHVIVMVAAGSAIAALVTGVILQVFWPVTLVQAAPAPIPTGVGFTAVSGWDCAAAADRGFVAQGRNADWYTVAQGGWASDGCHGTFVAIPMSGEESVDDSNQSAVWWFTPGKAVSRCVVEVYVPRGQKPQDAGAAAAAYDVLAGQSGSAFARFTVDQSAAAGSWVSAGTFPVPSGSIAVRLGNRGVPKTPDTRLAIAQVRVSCPGHR